MTSRERVRLLVDSSRFQWFIIALIILNAAILGIETSEGLLDAYAGPLGTINYLTVAVFVVELALRIYAHRAAFFRDGWSLFDLFVVLVALIPASGGLAVLLVLRVLRVLRLLSAVRSMRRVVAALAATVPGMVSIGALLLMMIYVAGVMATELFATTDPEHFGTLPESLLSLFQVMTGDDWANVIRPVTDAHPASWVFFIVYILISTYIVLNLFIAVAVEALNLQSDEETREIIEEIDESDDKVLAAIADLKGEVESLRAELARRG